MLYDNPTPLMDRNQMLDTLRRQKDPWDVVVIGGGATGLGTAVDAASRGYRTLLLERHDFAKGTSSRSTKLVHGGVRYLQQGDVKLVLEALQERGLMIKNAPHLVKNQGFVIPNYRWWDGPFYRMGLKVYDLMSGRLGIGSSRRLSKAQTIAYLPTIHREGLTGGVLYYDGQFDDARMAVSLARTAVHCKGMVLNYMQVERLLKTPSGTLEGVEARDRESGRRYAIRARSVVNATGVFADRVIRMDDPGSRPMIQPSQGVHLVLDREFLPGPYAIMVPNTSDGRVLFAVPWHNKIVLGTTDTPVGRPRLEPRARDREVDFILETAAQYLAKAPRRTDVKSVFAGLRPLIRPEKDEKATRQLSRYHRVVVSPAGLITVVGGKWTTYRKMAEDAVAQAIRTGNLPDRRCTTRNLPVFGCDRHADLRTDPLAVYGAERFDLLKLEEREPEWRGWLSQPLGIRRSQLKWAVQYEMARTVEDFLARRTRALFLDARESLRLAEEVARLMAVELGHNDAWAKQQVADYRRVADTYVLD